MPQASVKPAPAASSTPSSSSVSSEQAASQDHQDTNRVSLRPSLEVPLCVSNVYSAEESRDVNAAMPQASVKPAPAASSTPSSSSVSSEQAASQDHQDTNRVSLRPSLEVPLCVSNVYSAEESRDVNAAMPQASVKPAPAASSTPSSSSVSPEQAASQDHQDTNRVSLRPSLEVPLCVSNVYSAEESRDVNAAMPQASVKPAPAASSTLSSSSVSL